MELREYLRILVKRWWLIIPLTLISLVVSLLVSYSRTPLYESSSTYVTKLASNTSGLSQQADTVIYGLDTLTGRQQIVVTYCEIMMSGSVREQAFKLIGLDPLTFDTEPYTVKCTNPPQTNVISLVVRGPAPAVVKSFNEAIGLIGIARANSLYSFFALDSLDPVTLAEDPVWPKHLQNGILGGALGLVLGISLALLIEYLRSPLERLEAMSIRNPQLGTYNERYFRQRFEEETNRAHARLRPISLALLRLNPTEDFALLPETVQTTMLRNAALTMQDTLRQGDIVAYLRPNTFGILLAETPGDEAQALLQKLHMDIRARTFEANGYVSSFSANSGVVASSGGGLGYQATVEKASEALRVADEVGDNTIHLIRTTPRPFLTSEDSDVIAEPISSPPAASPFDSSVSPFGDSGLEEVTWDTMPTVGTSEWGAVPGSTNGNLRAESNEDPDIGLFQSSRTPSEN